MSERKPLTIKGVASEAFSTAEAAGWHDRPASLVERLCLMHSEISEALEDHRSGRCANEIYWEGGRGGKPCGIPIEIADLLIRTLELCAIHNIDIEEALHIKLEYNKKRPYRHGGKQI